VSFLVTTTLPARPRSASVTDSSLRPISSVITCPPVSTAMSCSIALRRSPNPGALTATTFSIPRSLLSTSVASASPSTSSATITNSRLPNCSSFSRIGTRSLAAEIFLSWIRMYASSITASIVSGCVMKYGEMYPRSNCMPST